MVIGFFQFLTYGLDALDQDGRAEYRAVQNRTDGAVRALPHLLQVDTHPYGLALGVMVAHLTATPYFLVASAESIVT